MSETATTTAPAADPTAQPPALLGSEAASAAGTDTAATGDASKTAAAAATDEAAIEARIAEAVKAAAPSAPETYEFAAPEINGKAVEIDQAKMEGFQAVCREAGMTQAQFAAVTGAGMERLQEMAAAPYRAWAEQQTAWQTEIKADPDIGGDALPENLSAANRAVEAFGGDALKQALSVTGAGNNPAIVRAFVAIGRAMGDSAGFGSGKPAGGARTTDPEQRARNFYNDAGGSYPPVQA